MKKRFDYPLSPRAKRDIGGEGGYSAFRIFSTADAVPEKIAHSRLRSRFLRCKNRCYGEPSFCCAKSGSIIRFRTKHKQTIEKMELIKTISSRVGTLRLAELRPLMRFPQFVACSRLHGRKKFLFPPFRRTMFFCCAKSGSIIRSRPKHKQTSFRMSERCKRRGWVLCISHFFDR